MRLVFFLDACDLPGEEIYRFDAQLIMRELSVDIGDFLRKLMVVEERRQGLLEFFFSELLSQLVGSHDSHHFSLGVDFLDLSFG